MDPLQNARVKKMYRGSTIAVIGGLNIDITGKPLTKGIPDNSNPGRVTLSLGGVACNIARCLSRLHSPLKTEVVLLTTVGDDTLSHFALRELSKEKNLNLSNIAIIEGKRCGTYLSIIEGERITAVSDMEVIDTISPKTIKRWAHIIDRATFVAIDTNIPTQSIDAILTITHKRKIPTLIQGVSVQKNEKLKELKQPFTYLSCNLKEYLALEPISRRGKGKSIPHVFPKITGGIIVTMGPEGAKFIPTSSGNQSTIHIPALPVKVINPNGAGDAFSAGFIYSLTSQMKIHIKKALRYGMAAANITLQSQEAVSDVLSPNMLETTLKTIKNN